MVDGTIVKNNVFKKSVGILLDVFTAFMIIGRLVSGVHWFSDIVGEVLFSSGLVMIYYSIFKR